MARYWDAERGGWVIEIPGTDDGTGKPRTYLSNSNQGVGLETAWQEERDEKLAKHFANVGNWQQYKDGSLEDFANALNRDRWFWSRLPRYAHNVMSGDTSQYNFQFDPSSGNTARGHELTNRYIALLNQGYTNQQIMGAGYGNDGRHWASWDKQGTNLGGQNEVDNTGAPAANQYQGYPVKGGAMPTYGIPAKGGYSSGYRNQFSGKGGMQ